MADWTSTHRIWDKWASHNIGSSGEPLKAALLLNYDSNGPSRLLAIILVGLRRLINFTVVGNFRPWGPHFKVVFGACRAEQEGIKLKAIELSPFLDFVKRNNLQKEYFSIGTNQYLVTSIHEHWFCARCVNTSKPAGEGVIVMQTMAYLLVAMYEGSIGAASQAMVAADQFVWQLNRRNH